MAKKKPDVVDTDPPEEARPDTTTTPLLVENGKVCPDVEFTPEELLKVFEYQATKHNRPRMHEAAWGIVQAIEKEDFITGAEILDIPPAWWEKKDIAQGHVNLIRAVFGNAERLNVFGTPIKAPPGLNTPATSSMSGASGDSEMMFSGLAEIMKESRVSLYEMQRTHEKAAADQAKAAAELSLRAIQA